MTQLELLILENVRLKRENYKMKEALENIGHWSEPSNCDNEDKIIGYLLCCEDVIKYAHEVLDEGLA